MSEPTPGKPHRREYAKPIPGTDIRLRAKVDVGRDGTIIITAECLDQILRQAGYVRLDGQPQS